MSVMAMPAPSCAFPTPSCFPTSSRITFSSSFALPKEFLPPSLRFPEVHVSAPIRKNPLPLRASSAGVVSITGTGTADIPRLKAFYLNKVVPALKEEFKYGNHMEIPMVKKVVVNCGLGEASQNAKILEAAIKDISTVTGQRPVITRAKKAIAAFKLREGMPVGIAVTLRGEVMYSFLDRVLNLVLPRTRDFLGVNPYSFDGRGNYHLGLKEHSVFPEIKFDSIDNPRGMNISIVTTARTDKESQRLLTLLGMPFKTVDASRKPSVLRRKKVRYNIKSKGGKSVKAKKK